jgi:signal transduction histidine kinase
LEDQREARRLDERHTRIRYALLTAMGVVALLALGFALGLGERGFGLFAAAILCQMVYLMLIGGEIRFSPPSGDAVTATLKAGRTIVGLGVASFALFVRQYLDLAARQAGLARLFVICAALSFAKVVWNLFSTPDWLGVFGNWLIITLAVATLVAILRGCMRRERGAWYMVFAWTPMLILSTLAAAQGLGHFEGARSLQYLFAASFAYSGLVLAAGLIDRSLRVRRERGDAIAEAEQRGRQLATASHDIRQPLLALRTTLSRLTRDGTLAPAIVERFRGSLEYLDRLASEYTSGNTSGGSGRIVAGHESGDTKENPGEALPVDMLVRNIELMFRDEAEAKGLELRVRSSRATVRVDAMAAMRVVSNLVANAVKYTQRGAVLVGCRRRGARIALVIADTGPGMTPEELTRVFQEGERGSGAAGTEGQGLGLSIAARLAAQYGFGLLVRSVPGRGTRFTVELPLAD